MYRAKYPVMDTAPADVDLQCFPDFSLCGVWSTVEQCLDGDNQARRAETALCGLFFEKRFLDGMQILTATQTFQGADIRSRDFGNRKATRWDGLAVNQHFARTALVEAASETGGRQPEFVPQNGQKGG